MRLAFALISGLTIAGAAQAQTTQSRCFTDSFGKQSCQSAFGPDSRRGDRDRSEGAELSGSIRLGQEDDSWRGQAGEVTPPEQDEARRKALRDALRKPAAPVKPDQACRTNDLGQKICW